MSPRDLDQDFRARAGDGEAAEVEEIEIGRRIGPPQRAIERERRQRERRLEALRQHDLEGVAGGDVVLGLAHHRLVFGRRGVGFRRHVERAGVEFGQRLVERPVEAFDDAGQPLDRARERGLGVDAFLRAHRRHHRDRILHRVEHDDDGRAHQHRVGNADRIGIGRRQFLHQPHHVVAEIAEHAGRHRRQAVGQVDAAFRDQRAQRLERRLGAGREGVGLGARAAVDLGLRAVGAPDQIRLEPDDRIAAAHRAAFHRLQQKAHRLAAAELEEGRDRRLQVGDQRGPHHLRLRRGRSVRRMRFPTARSAWAQLIGWRAAADDLVQRRLVERDAEIVFEPRDIFADDVVGVGILQRGRELLGFRRVGSSVGIDRRR